MDIHFDKLNDSSLIFLNLDYVEDFVKLIKSANLNSKFTLVTHNSDRHFDQQIFDSLSQYVNRIYAINCTIENNIITKIPLGFSDRSLPFLEKSQSSFSNKENLVYLNFTKGNHSDRLECFNYFSNRKWVTTDDSDLSFLNFYDRLKSSKYCISPRGVGIDTHRIYESIFLDTIPIVKSSELNSLYKNFPILIVDDWSEITEDFLTAEYQNTFLKLIKWKETAVRNLFSKSWINQ